MTDQNQQNHTPAQEKGNGNGQNSRNRHHRHHRPYHKNHHRNHPADRENDLQKEEVTQENTAEKETQQSSQPRQKSETQQKEERGKNPHKDHKEHKDQKDRKDRQNGKPRHGSNHRFNRESRPYDPYETPSKQEIELSELRAQIVLKSADGTVPTAYAATPKASDSSVANLPEAKEQPVEHSEEAIACEAAAESAEPEMPQTEQPEEEVPTVEVIGIRFRSAGKMYYFDPHGIQVKKGDSAIVETTRGPEFGDVCLANTFIKASQTVSPLRPLIRIATPADVAQNAENREKEKNALVVCQEKIQKHGLEMKLIDVQYAFDGSKLLFYFAAEGRVDFRELVKDLASVFRTRIELRQIGIRDEAKMLGGIGACGRPLCCSTFLPDFAQVSIKMAKDQNLSLNSSKISGVCGRLMCCLRYESEVYAEEIRKTPSNDTVVRTEDGVGVVIGSNPLAGTVRVLLKDNPDTAPKQYHRDNVTVLGKEKRGADTQNHAQESDVAQSE